MGVTTAVADIVTGGVISFPLPPKGKIKMPT